MFRLRRKKKESTAEIKRLREIMHEELSQYIKQENLREYLDKIEKDKDRKKAWDSLPMRKKNKVLRYVVEQKGVKHGKG